MAKKEKKPMLRISERCELCGRIFAKRHPISKETICERCRNGNKAQHRPEENN